MRYRVIHTEHTGDGCHQTAFFMNHKPVDGEIIDADGVTLLDGSTPTYGEHIICGSCHKTILYLHASNVVEDVAA